MTASTSPPPQVRVWSIALAGMDGRLVEIGAQLEPADGPAGYAWLPDDVRTVRERVRAAIRNSGYTWPFVPVTLALPAVRGWANMVYDLPAALAVLLACGQLPPDAVAGAVALGELGLDGSLRPVRGVLAARAAGMRRAILPRACQAEARLVPGMEITAADTLAELAVLLTVAGRNTVAEAELEDRQPNADADPDEQGDLADVRCSAATRRALLVAAAGGHPIQLAGPGRILLARLLPGLLPPLGVKEVLELAAIRSLAGMPYGPPLPTAVPYVAPHHSTSLPALIGGGPSARPGALSLACHGVLHLNEPEQFGPHRLEVLRVALDNGEVRLAFRACTAIWPARFLLVLTPHNTTRRVPVSPMVLDRVPIRVDLPDKPAAEPAWPRDTTAVARDWVIRARQRAAARWASVGAATTNATVDARHLEQEKPLWPAARAELYRLCRIGALTERGALQLIRVAWTIADLDLAAYPGPEQITEALALRGLRPADRREQ